MTMKRKLCTIFGLLLTFTLAAAPAVDKNSDQFNVEIPWLSTYYIQPLLTVKDAVKVGFYVTDWHQSEYRLLDNSHRFHVTLKIRKKEFQNRLSGEEKVMELRDIKAGDHEFNAGTFPEGEYQIALSAEDIHGRKSTSLFHEFMVVKNLDITEAETYRMKEKDFKLFRISNQGDLGEIRFIDATGKNLKETTELVAKAAENVTAPSGKYVVIAGGEKYNPAENKNHRGAQAGPVPEWLPNSWSWKSCKVIYAEDYNREQVEKDAVRNGKGLNQLIRIAKREGYRKVVLMPGTYRISNTTPIQVPAGITLDLNGAVIKLNQFAGCHGMQIKIMDGFDTHVVNGIVEGDYFEHDYENSEKNSEWVCGIGMEGESKYSSFERILVRYITGYGVTHGSSGHYASHIPVKGFEPGTIDEKTGERLPDAAGLSISDPIGIAGFLDDGGYLAVSRFLGYQGMVGGSDWSLRFHFYDDEENYLETIRGRQYKRVRVPEKAGYVRVTSYAFHELPLDSDFVANLFRAPWNSWYKDLFILSARCVGMAPGAMYNFRVENCSFVRSGENSAKCAFDAEDGWDMMQDVWFIRNKFFKNPINEFLCCSGHNFIFEDNEARFHLWDRTNGYVVRNNEFTSAFYGAGSTRARTGLIRVSGNTYKNSVHLGNRPARPKKGEKPKKIDAVKAAEGALAAVDPSLLEEAEEKTEKGKEQVKKIKPTPWFVVMKDAANAPQVGCGPNGILAGVSLKDIKTGTVNLLDGILRGSKNMQLAGSTFIKSRLYSITGSINRGVLTMADTLLRDGQISVGGDGAVVIKDSDLRNVTFRIGHWTTPVKLIFENCIIRNKTEPLISTGVYSIGDFQFVNCQIETGSAGAIRIYDMRQNNNGDGKNFENKTGKILFENCIIDNQKKCVVSIESKGESRKKIVLDDKGNQYKYDFVSLKPAHWAHQESDGSGKRKKVKDLPRGRSDKKED